MVATEVLGTQVVRALTTTVLQERTSLWQSPRARLKKRLREAIGTAPDEPLGVLESLMAHADLSAFDARRASSRWGRASTCSGFRR